MSDKSFELGELVTWSSQSQASRTTKTGVIVDVLPAGKRPEQGKWPSLYRGASCGSSRSRLSYVVQVGTKIYWPHAKNLKLVESVTA